MTNPFSMNQDTQGFFEFVGTKIMNDILDSIAAHYAITRSEAFDEVVDVEAENIMDYVTKNRPAVHLFYKKYKQSK